MIKNIVLFISIFTFSLTACSNDQQSPDEQQSMQDQQQTPADQNTGESMDVSEEDLESYVDANLEIQDEQLDPQNDRAEIEEAIENSGLELQEFEEIQMAVQMDPQLQQQVQSIMEEKVMDQGTDF